MDFKYFKIHLKNVKAKPSIICRDLILMFRFTFTYLAEAFPKVTNK